MMRRIFLNPLLDAGYPEIADTLWKVQPNLGGLSRQFINGTRKLWARADAFASSLRSACTNSGAGSRHGLCKRFRT
jgi:hypothetical protein